MKVLLLGSGGREHALYWKMSQSPEAETIHVYPGNGGIPESALIQDQKLNLSDLSTVQEFVRGGKYDLVVVGPEQPLVDGIVDALEGICPVFGPSKGAAQLEGSKKFSKAFMDKYNVPTAAARSFTEVEPALAYIKEKTPPIVVKADGLAAGKGVTVATELAQAEKAIRDCLEENIFGASGSSVLIEDFLQGEEASVFALCDGEQALPFIAAQDHKRAFDNDEGPNTGGMGAYTPVPLMNPEIMEKVQREVLDPVLKGMQSEGTPYRGLLYAGLMIHEGQPRVVEFNVRFGDPETQALLRILDEDLLDLMYLAAADKLPDRPLKFKDEAAIVVVLAADGYPGSYKKNIKINNLDNTERDIMFFHAGTRRSPEGLQSTGGRILGATATGNDLSAAIEAAYRGLKNIDAPDTFYRKDIGRKALP